VRLPLPLRNCLAELIIDALHDPGRRRGLEAVATIGAGLGKARPEDLPPGVPHELFEERDGALEFGGGHGDHAAEFAERAGRAWRAIRDRPLDPSPAPLETALAAAARLFDAGLYFEVHELLEPYWMKAAGADRQTLQGLIQIAVGFQHLANGNLAGARALLRDGVARTAGGEIGGRDLGAFAAAVEKCLGRLVSLDAITAREVDWTAVPPFPAAAGARPGPGPDSPTTPPATARDRSWNSD